ncbi:MAG: hypothetical protein H6Q43_3304, partial [Deltaproteobacteria bacterium]|nr:hypothetical protein [Deltaproteobacteria bacterium]
MHEKAISVSLRGVTKSFGKGA